MALTAIIGTGAWGLACAELLCESARAPVVVWGRDAGKCATLQAHYGARFAVTADADRLASADLLLWAVPVQHSAQLAQTLAPALRGSAPMLSLSKGFDERTLLAPSALLHAQWPSRDVGCISGPSLAGEVVRGLPLALVAAGSGSSATLAAERLHGPRLRVYLSTDVLGVEMCGAMKNVIAIAAGMADGLGLGDNARASLLTRGMAEIRRLGRACGAQDATFAGLAGFGDLIATCSSPLSRNRRLGLSVAAGAHALDIVDNSATVAEGAWTCRAAVALGLRHQVELPICSQVAAVLWDQRPVAIALSQLLSRAPKDEDA